jgi:opacity protein-like surface antigen
VVGGSYVELATPTAKTPQFGNRGDIGAKVEYTPKKDTLLYAFGQVTIDRSGTVRRNDRVGVGAKVKLTDKIGLEAEISEGTTGLGGLAALTYDPSADKHLYVGYKLDPDRAFDRTDDVALSGVDLGGIVLGSRLKHNDVLSTFTENSYDMFGRRRSLASTYGVTYTPDKYLTATAGIEIGRIEDPNINNADFDRYAPSFALNFHDEAGLNARIRGEARFETSEDGTRDRETYLLSAGYVNSINPDWRISINADAVISNSDQTSVLDGDYVEATVGFAYRPVENDRLNALFKYTFLYDLPGPDQTARGTGTVLGPAQRSHIISADFIYDLNEYVSLGAKYGFRYGEISTTRAPQDFTSSSAHLGVLRADLHVVKNWDLLLEGRVFHQPEAKSTRFGALAAVYYHVSENMKAGVGYNFGRFSDDLTDITQDDEGVFLNVIGKY